MGIRRNRSSRRQYSRSQYDAWIFVESSENSSDSVFWARCSRIFGSDEWRKENFRDTCQVINFFFFFFCLRMRCGMFETTTSLWKRESKAEKSYIEGMFHYSRRLLNEQDELEYSLKNFMSEEPEVLSQKILGMSQPLPGSRNPIQLWPTFESSTINDLVSF